MDNLGQQGVLAVVPPAALEAQLQQQAQQKAQMNQPPAAQLTDLIGYIKSQYEIMRNHRNTQSGWSDRLLVALRAINGQYSAEKLAEITKFGGSTVYARLIAQKCRAASSLLRDIYLGQDRPWGVRPPVSAQVPPEVIANINQLVQTEMQHVAQQLGQPPDQSKVEARRKALMDSAEDAAKRKAAEQARESEDRIEDILRTGGYYQALAEFLVDLPIFPFACIKGPVVKVIPEVEWPQGGGKPTISHKPRLTWNRVSPFDIWWTPGATDIENANVIEKLRITRAELNDLLDLPGYNTDEIRAVLDEYGRGGLYDNWDTTDAERAVLESRENPAWNRSAMISMMEFNGTVQGRMLQDYGLAVPDELRDYTVQVWCIGNHVIKAHLSPSPRQRHPYFITSFEKVPGTIVGNGLTDILTDLQEAGNAVLRSLINNVSISSGPQVVVNDDAMANTDAPDDLYPWKRWHVRGDVTGMMKGGGAPIQFFQPQSNAQELITLYKSIVEIADDVSAIPKYIGGQAGSGGAGRTASGLAMLMGNASKLLQTVSANVDRDVLEPSLLQLTDLILLTDASGMLNGEERVTVQGVNVAVQRETLRQRQIEFLQATNNPTDMKIMGIKGRATVLRSVSTTIGMSGEDVVPDQDQIEKMVQQEQQQQQQGGGFDQQVQEGIHKGVEAGVQRISTELTAGLLAAHAHMPEGMPTHIGTLPEGQGQQPQSPDGGRPSAGHASHSSLMAGAAHAQGTQPSELSHGGPQTHLVGNQPGPGAKPVSGGPA
jgi:hypothetical protein